MRLIQEAGNTDLNIFRLGKTLELEILRPRGKKKIYIKSMKENLKNL